MEYKADKFLRNESMRISIAAIYSMDDLDVFPQLGFYGVGTVIKKGTVPPKKKKHHQIHAELWTSEYI